MKTLYVGEARKDFLENWKSINRDLIIPKFDMPSELKFYQRMSEQNRQGFSISNMDELRIEYVYMGGISRNLNHSAHKFIQDSYNYSWQQIPKEYHEFLLQVQRRLVLNAMNSCKPEDSLKVEAFVDYKYKLAENKPECFRMLQRISVFEADKNNHPIFLINQFSDITYLKKKEDCTLAIKMPDGKVLFYKFNVCSKSVFNFKSMSEHEITIVHLLARGLSSKQIAEILFISPHTVDTHRRSLLEITNCVDTTALIIYCMMLGII